MNSSVFLAVASAVLFVLVFQGGEAADIVLQDIVRSKRDLKTEDAPPIVNLNGNYNYHAAQQFFFIMNAPPTVTKETKNCATDLERDDYIVRPGIGVHKMHKQKAIWNNARKSCMEEGASLVVLNSALEETTLLNMMKSESVDRVWLGVHDQFGEGDWVTVSGESLDTVGYQKWSMNPWPNQPDNYGGRQNCALLIKEEGMDDTECDHLNAYICEINLC